MAEVGQRLAGGAVHRLSALRNSHGVPTHPGRSTAPVIPASCNDVTARREESGRECQLVSKRRTTRRKSTKLSAVGAAESAAARRERRFAAPVEPYPAPELRVHETAVFISVRLQPLLCEKLLSGRMTAWTRAGGVGESPHPGAVGRHLQLRALCTITFILADRPQRLRLWCPQLHRELTVATRGYSWRRDNNSSEAPPKYKSRTAYYDILKVSPSATQAQIKTAYYKQSFIYHPDKNQGSETATQRFSEISEAYTVLGNITLRRRYDRGLLSQSDLQSAGRPSSKEAASRSSGSTQQQQHQQQHPHKERRFTRSGERVKFDFDAFYQAHYGEQLQREWEMRERRRRLQEQQQRAKERAHQRMLEMSLVMLATITGCALVTFLRP